MSLLLSSWALITTAYAVFLVVKDSERESLIHGLDEYAQTLEKELDRFNPPSFTKEERKALYDPR